MTDQPENQHLVPAFLEFMADNYPIYYKSVAIAKKNQPVLFDRYATILLQWATNYLGKATMQTLLDGYITFTTHMNEHQKSYEQRGFYLNKSYKHAAEHVYQNQEFMSLYHWGVYTNTFLWSHHLTLCEFFERHFLQNLGSQPIRLLDLGCGSGLWHLLGLTQLPQASVVALDISETSIHLAKGMAKANGFENKVIYQQKDALTTVWDQPFDAAISCFLLEHLEQPQLLLENLARNVQTRGLVFVTVGLTAAELDHIFEFRRESELVCMAEASGFRVLATFSSSPQRYPKDLQFLPRSMALVLQKRHTNLW